MIGACFTTCRLNVALPRPSSSFARGQNYILHISNLLSKFSVARTVEISRQILNILNFVTGGFGRKRWDAVRIAVR
jgi:hypothetical protein